MCEILLNIHIYRLPPMSFVLSVELILSKSIGGTTDYIFSLVSLIPYIICAEFFPYCITPCYLPEFRIYLRFHSVFVFRIHSVIASRDLPVQIHDSFKGPKPPTPLFYGCTNLNWFILRLTRHTHD